MTLEAVNVLVHARQHYVLFLSLLKKATVVAETSEKF